VRPRFRPRPTCGKLWRLWRAKVQCQSDPIDHPRMDQNETRNHETGAFSNRFLDFGQLISISIPIDFLISINSRILIINGNWSSFFDQKHPRLRTNGIHISYTPIGPTMSQVCVDSLLNHGFVKFLGRFSCVSFFRKGLLWTNKHDFKTIYIKTAATSMKPHCKSLAVSPRIMGMCNSCSVPSGISQPCFITDHFQNGNPNIMD